MKVDSDISFKKQTSLQLLLLKDELNLLNCSIQFKFSFCLME
jgi:hypothetical protein